MKHIKINTQWLDLEADRISFGGGFRLVAVAGPTQINFLSNYFQNTLKPYVETMLGAAQKQAYKYDDSGNIVGFQPYIPYGATVDAAG